MFHSHQKTLKQIRRKYNDTNKQLTKKNYKFDSNSSVFGCDSSEHSKMVELHGSNV